MKTFTAYFVEIQDTHTVKHAITPDGVSIANTGGLFAHTALMGIFGLAKNIRHAMRAMEKVNGNAKLVVARMYVMHAME